MTLITEYTLIRICQDPRYAIIRRPGDGLRTVLRARLA